MRIIVLFNIGLCLTLSVCPMVMARSEPPGNPNSISYKQKSDSRHKQSRLERTDQVYGAAKSSYQERLSEQDKQTRLLEQLKVLSSQIEQLNANVKELTVELHNPASGKQQLSTLAKPTAPSLTKSKKKDDRILSGSGPVMAPEILAEPPTGDMQTWVNELRNHNLTMPLAGTQPESIKGSFYEARPSGRHEAVDIPAPRSTPVLAVEGGRIARLFTSKAGGLTIYQQDPTKRYIYYYAHLDRYAADLREGDSVKRQQIIGFVGTTGNAPANYPHLHFSISRVADGASIFHGIPIDPYEVFKADSQQMGRSKHQSKQRESS